jgi:cholesterol oxidase
LARSCNEQEGELMAGFDYDVVIIGSGFGGSVAALRAAEKGYRVGVMESGRRWADEDIPKTQWDLAHFVWFPAAELYGVQRIEYLDDVLVLSGAGVGGGSHVYASTMYVPPKQFFDAKEWAGITDWAGELAPYFDQAARMFGVVRYPYMPTDVDRAIKQVANDIGRGETHNKAPLAVYFGTPGAEADDPYFGGVGPRRTGCISCGNCNNGCGHNAKNKLTTNYLYLAEKLGARVRDMNEVFDLVPLEGGGFEVHTRHPGWAQRAGHLDRNTYTAEQVIVAAHAYGSAKLLHHMQHKGRLTGLSSELGKRARTNSEQLLYITRTHAEWERDRERIHIMPGSVTITSGTWPDPVTSIEPDLLGARKQRLRVPRDLPPAWRAEAFVRVLAQGDPHASERGDLARRPATLVRALLCCALLADDRYLDRAVLARRPAPLKAIRNAAVGARAGDRGLRRSCGEEAGSPRGGARNRGHQPQRLCPFCRRDPDRREQ